ncbi:MAG: hypothetical protein HQK89_05215 [Nitrospirae bacterium]|nr:hypothetical protein [Nitrospirota bacterium]
MLNSKKMLFLVAVAICMQLLVSINVAQAAQGTSYPDYCAFLNLHSSTTLTVGDVLTIPAVTADGKTSYSVTLSYAGSDNCANGVACYQPGSAVHFYINGATVNNSSVTCDLFQGNCAMVGTDTEGVTRIVMSIPMVDAGVGMTSCKAGDTTLNVVFTLTSLTPDSTGHYVINLTQVNINSSGAP